MTNDHQPTGGDGNKLKILIVEDSPNINLLYDRGLPDAVFEKKFATNGQAGLSIYDEWQPDIMILDVMLPVMTGYTLLKTIRLQRKDLQTTVIISTSLSGKEDVTSLMRLGVQGYIVKPFVMKKIGEQILQYYDKTNPARAAGALAVYGEVIDGLVQSSSPKDKLQPEENDESLIQYLPDFTAEDFTGSLSLDGFFQVFDRDQPDMMFSSKDNPLERINELLQIPNLFEIILAKKKQSDIPGELRKLAAAWQTYRNGNYTRMTVTSQKKVRLLNRLLLEAIYSDHLPKMKHPVS